MAELEKKESCPKLLANFKLRGCGRVVPPKVTDQTDVVSKSESSPTDWDEKPAVD